jgi:hypothetical protein
MRLSEAVDERVEHVHGANSLDMCRIHFISLGTRLATLKNADCFLINQVIKRGRPPCNHFHDPSLIVWINTTNA